MSFRGTDCHSGTVFLGRRLSPKTVYVVVSRCPLIRAEGTNINNNEILALGRHTIVYTVTDANGNLDRAAMFVDVGMSRACFCSHVARLGGILQVRLTIARTIYLAKGESTFRTKAGQHKP